MTGDFRHLSAGMRRAVGRALAHALIAVAAILAGFNGRALAVTPFTTSLPQAILIDAATGSVLFAKDADTHIQPAAMAKLMTTAVAFDALKAGTLHLTDTFPVSENAWRKGGAPSGGTTMFAKLNSSLSVDDLLHGIIVISANDGCIALAEGMAGSEAAFAGKMNAEAAKFGLANSHFTNATGLPDPAEYVTVRDVATLAQHIVADFPEYYPLYAQRDFTWNKIHQFNTNPLLDMGLGADGLKTGYSDQSGYALVGSAVGDGRRLIVAVSGAKSEKERATESQKLLQWGFANFQPVSYFRAGEKIAEARVFGGSTGSVALVSKEPIDVLLPRDGAPEVDGRVVYRGPVQAPVKAGQEIGTLELTVDDQLLREAKLYAASDVGVGDFRERLVGNVRELLFGWW